MTCPHCKSDDTEDVGPAIGQSARIYFCNCCGKTFKVGA